MRFLNTLVLACLSALAYASPITDSAIAATVGSLTYGDVFINLSTGCQQVPQNKEDNLPKPRNLFTKLQVNAGYTCTLYRQQDCHEDFRTTKGPGASAEYESSWLFSAACSSSN